MSESAGLVALMINKKMSTPTLDIYAKVRQPHKEAISSCQVYCGQSLLALD